MKSLGPTLHCVSSEDPVDVDDEIDLLGMPAENTDNRFGAEKITIAAKEIFRGR